jgi:hypothetical protein
VFVIASTEGGTVIISQSQLSMSAAYSKLEVTQTRERLSAWVDGGARVESASTSGRPLLPSQNEDEARGALAVEIERLKFSAQSQRMDVLSEVSNSPTPRPGKRVGDESKTEEEEEMGSTGDIKLEVMRLIIEKMSGRKVLVAKEALPDEEDRAAAEQNAQALAQQAQGRGDQAPPAQASEGWGLEYERTQIHVEKESSSFSSSGVIRTADGKDITFNVGLEMSREKIEVSHLSLRAGDAAKLVDPLVINFGGNAAALTAEKIDFDLNADGTKERISFLASGSGFLVLDRNQDGVVNNGSELFGPTTGDGFAELSRHDEDGNGWIDEADSVYEHLSVWTLRTQGQDSLLSLRQVGVGAISLMSAKTPYTLETQNGETAGVVRSTGVYLKEDGGVGTVQQIDLVT